MQQFASYFPSTCQSLHLEWPPLAEVPEVALSDIPINKNMTSIERLALILDSFMLYISRSCETLVMGFCRRRCFVSLF